MPAQPWYVWYADLSLRDDLHLADTPHVGHISHEQLQQVSEDWWRHQVKLPCKHPFEEGVCVCVCRAGRTCVCALSQPAVEN